MISGTRGGYVGEKSRRMNGMRFLKRLAKRETIIIYRIWEIYDGERGYDTFKGGNQHLVSGCTGNARLEIEFRGF